MILLTKPFGFGTGGRMEVRMEAPGVFLREGAQAADRRRMGLFLAAAEAEPQIQQDLDAGSCALDSENVDLMFTLDEASNGTAAGPFVYENELSKGTGGLYSVYFANCEGQALVSLDAVVSLWNGDGKGGRDYLSEGEQALPSLYLLFFLVFAAAGGYWSFLVLKKHKATAHRIHQLMIVLVVFKALTLLSQCLMYHYIRVTGSPDGWNIAYYFFTFIRGLMFFAVVVLIGTGWSYMKPFLNDQEKRLLYIVLPLQVLSNMAYILTDDRSPAQRAWFTWNDIFTVVDIACCCAVLFPLVWSIKRLKENAQVDGKAAQSMAKMKLFKDFYVMVITYVYFTRIIEKLLRFVLPYEHSWLCDASGELATLAFYVLTGMKVFPAEHNPYFSIPDDVGREDPF